MKTSLVLQLLVLNASAAVLPAAVPFSRAAAAHPVMAVEVAAGKISPGHTSGDAERVLGFPAWKLAEHVWVYHNFSGGDAQAPDDNCHLLVITFTHGRVSDLQLVNQRALDILTGQFAGEKRRSAVVSVALADTP